MVTSCRAPDPTPRAAAPSLGSKLDGTAVTVFRFRHRTPGLGRTSTSSTVKLQRLAAAITDTAPPVLPSITATGVSLTAHSKGGNERFSRG
ncbi:hypothetical protein V498_08140 [Pseudogymnoascus sp. VKM F-4517 (FW-2822)]|nr:hypothetical protein V498_08140 [Pseudogymnoascus sp. VKM F-4517 (FW-2822)]